MTSDPMAGTAHRPPPVANDDSLADDPRVVQAVQEYLVALEAGEPVDRDVYVARHPDIAAELAECLAGLDLIHAAAGNWRETPLETISVDQAAISSPQPLGDFRIVREIGRGGMGVVYEAMQLSLGRRVALKVLPFAAALDPKQLQRFKNEAQAAAQLHHNNIVPVYAVGCERGVHFYAMQLIQGHSLSVLIRQMRALAGRGGNGEADGDTSELVSKLAWGQLVPERPPSERSSPAAAGGVSQRGGAGEPASGADAWNSSMRLASGGAPAGDASNTAPRPA